MKKTGFFFILAFALKASALLGQSFIHVDQFGYLPDGEKVAVVSDPIFGFNAEDSFDASGVFELVIAETDFPIGTYAASEWQQGNVHDQSGDRGAWVDFSDFTIAGNYYLRHLQSGATSDTFSIQDRVYRDVLQAAMKMFYYNRCNHDKVTPYADERWTDGNNFRNPLQDENCRYYLDPDNESLEKELSGGWFDAGDYNKYVNYAMYAVEDLLSAYEENPLAFGGNWGIPESSNDIPDILDEIKYELDWIYKMTNGDGSVHMKMGSISFSENAASPPSVNTDQRYYGKTCTSSSLATALLFSHASKVFASIGELDYADKLKARAIDCFNYVVPFIDGNNLETDCENKFGVINKLIKARRADLMFILYVFVFSYNTRLTASILFLSSRNFDKNVG